MNKPNTSKSGVFALGNFDGVHRGHRAVVEMALEKARELGTSAHVVTFEPHPRVIFQPDAPPFRLTPAAVKDNLLRLLGVTDIITLPFTREFSELSPEGFVQKILIKQLNVGHILAGHDFVFGHKRGGNMALLRNWLEPYGVGITEVHPLADAKGKVLSSSRTRAALHEGDVKTATDILGRAWSISGIVEQGAKRGTSIGVPTANISLGEYLRPKFGVYAVEARLNGKTFKGVANIGNRPTVDGVTEKLEAHLFDFGQDIYGQPIEVALTGFIRPEQKFENIDALKMQIETDIKAARSGSF